MLFENEDNRQKRVKAMLQYLILREACEFYDRFPRGDDNKAEVEDVSKAQNKEKFKTESAEKILSAMESKFYDFFVDDDLVENLFLHDNSEKGKIGSKRGEIEKKIKTQIEYNIEKIQLLSATDAEATLIKNDLKKIFQSPIIENLIMTCDLANELNDTYLTATDDSPNSFLIPDIDNVFNSSNFKTDINDNFLTKIRDDFLSKRENECCKIEETFTAIHANIATITAIGCGIINLTGKIINKSLGLEQDSKTGVENSAEAPSESVRGDRITQILTSLPISHGYV